MKHLSIPTLIITLAIASPAVAQVAPSPIGTPSPLGVTTPLGMGPGAPVAPVGIPLGATQLSSPGASPAVAGIVPQNAISGNTAACGATISTTGMSTPTPLFDASAGTVSGTCATSSVSASSNPAASGSSPTGMGSVAAVGRVGIPLGSAELDPGGLSLPPPATSLTSALPVATAVPATPLMISPLGATTSSSATTMSPSSTTSQTTSSTCVGVPGNINATGSSAGSTAGSC
jgi:hypothetical protein